MVGRTDGATLAAAAAVLGAIAWAGGYAPLPRLLVTAALALVAAWSAAAWRGRLELAEALALGVVAWGALSAALSRGYPFAAKEMLAAWLLAWGLFVLARRTGAKARSRVLTLLAAGAAVTAGGVLAVAVGVGRLRVGGMYRNPNVAIALVVPVLALVWWEAGPLRGRWRWPLAALVAAAAVASGSRAALLALVVAAAVALPERRWRWPVVAAVAAAAAAIVSWRLLVHPDTLAWHRPAIWSALAELVARHPLLGVGPGWLEDATGVVRLPHGETVASFRHVIGSAESTLLGLAVRTGMGGLALAGAAVAVWARSLPAATRSGRLARGVALAVMGMMGLFHDFLDQPVVLWEWALLAGCLAPVVRQPSDTTAGRSGPRGARVLAGLAAAWLLLWGAAQPAFARWWWWRDASSVELARRAMGADPWYAEPAEWVTRHLLMEQRWGWKTAGEALSWSRRGTALHPGSATVWSDFGMVNARIAEDLGPWPDAIAGARRGYERATELEPHLPWHWLRWAQLERALGDGPRALVLAKRAVAQEPNFARGWLFLGRVELDQGRTDEARTALERALAAHRLAEGRNLSPYERDLLTLPPAQVEQLESALSTVKGAQGGSR